MHAGRQAITRFLAEWKRVCVYVYINNRAQNVDANADAQTLNIIPEMGYIS